MFQKICTMISLNPKWIVIAVSFLAFASMGIPRPHVVRLGAGGFFPSTVVVARGETVTFTTTWNRPFWPASDFHPDHRLYPEFDPKRPVAPGQTWSFRFDRAGTWNYHNHLGSQYSPDTGTVIVVESGVTAPTIPRRLTESACWEIQADGVRRRCWEQLLVQTLHGQGIRATFILLAHLYEKDPFVATNCNDITHKIGGAAYGYYRTHLSDVAIPETLFCNAGFYHGLMEVFLNQRESIPHAKRFCSEVEDRLSGTSPLAAIACYHGLGHGSMELFGIHAIADWRTTLPTILREGFDLCQGTGAKPELVASCVNGIFNSLQMHYHESPYKPDPIPYWICRGVSVQYKTLCYEGVSSNLMWAGQADFSRAADIIEKTVEPSFIGDAIRKISQIKAFASVGKKNWDEDIRACQALPGSLSDICLSAFSEGLIDNGPPGKEYTDALLFCGSSLFTPAGREHCLKTSISYTRTYYSGGRADFCRTLPAEFIGICGQ